MGTMTYDGTAVEFDDRVLAHLQIVIVLRFRKGEGFLMSWKDSLEVGSGRSSIWLSPFFPIYFKFYGSRPPAVDRDWLELLTQSAASSQGLVVMDEHGKPMTGIARPRAVRGI